MKRALLPLSLGVLLCASCATNEHASSHDSAPEIASGEHPAPEEEIPDRHERPIVRKNGRTLLWANDDEWFDMTAAKIDPYRFQFGIGKDTIASIDDPAFAYFDDPRVAQAGIDLETPVLGVFLEGEAKAYPVTYLDRHEVVNDLLEQEPYAVLW